MAEKYEGSEQIAPWVSKPEIRHKIVSKMGEIQQELERTRGVVQGLKHLLLVNPNTEGTPGTRDRAYIPPPLQRSVDELKGWVMSLVESTAYVQVMLRSWYGAYRCKSDALKAMEKGDKRATADARASGINMPDSGINYEPSGPVPVCPPRDPLPDWVYKPPR